MLLSLSRTSCLNICMYASTFVCNYVICIYFCVKVFRELFIFECKYVSKCLNVSI